MDPDAKRQLLRTVPYGLYAATTRSPEDEHHIFLLSWLTQVSFDPPLVAVCVHKEGKAYQHLAADPPSPLAINLLGEDQQPLGQELLKKPDFQEDAVAGTGWKTGETGVALLPATLGALEVRVREEAGHEGDHGLFVCEVVAAHAFREGEPLTHANTGWKYGG